MLRASEESRTVVTGSVFPLRSTQPAAQELGLATRARVPSRVTANAAGGPDSVVSRGGNARSALVSRTEICRPSAPTPYRRLPSAEVAARYGPGWPTAIRPMIAPVSGSRARAWRAVSSRTKTTGSGAGGALSSTSSSGSASRPSVPARSAYSPRVPLGSSSGPRSPASTPCRRVRAEAAPRVASSSATRATPEPSGSAGRTGEPDGRASGSSGSRASGSSRSHERSSSAIGPRSCPSVSGAGTVTRSPVMWVSMGSTSDPSASWSLTDGSPHSENGTRPYCGSVIHLSVSGAACHCARCPGAPLGR